MNFAYIVLFLRPVNLLEMSPKTFDYRYLCPQQPVQYMVCCIHPKILSYAVAGWSCLKVMDESQLMVTVLYPKYDTNK